MYNISLQILDKNSNSTYPSNTENPRYSSVRKEKAISTIKRFYNVDSKLSVSTPFARISCLNEYKKLIVDDFK